MAEEFNNNLGVLKKELEKFLGVMKCLEFENLFNYNGQYLGTVHMFSDEKYSYGKTWMEGIKKENKRANDAEKKIEEILEVIGHSESSDTVCGCLYCKNKRR